MALTIPNLTDITKQDVKLGEALKRIQEFTNTNVTPVTGNRIPSPPTNPSRPPG